MDFISGEILKKNKSSNFTVIFCDRLMYLPRKQSLPAWKFSVLIGFFWIVLLDINFTATLIYVNSRVDKSIQQNVTMTYSVARFLCDS